jgi:hypothetical protein
LPIGCDGGNDCQKEADRNQSNDHNSFRQALFKHVINMAALFADQVMGDLENLNHSIIFE